MRNRILTKNGIDYDGHGGDDDCLAMVEWLFDGVKKNMRRRKRVQSQS